MPAEAVLAASSPGQPCVWLLRFVDEALWAELVRVGIQLGVVVHEVGAAYEVNGGTVCPAANLDLLDNHSWDGEEEYRLVA